MYIIVKRTTNIPMVDGVPKARPLYGSTTPMTQPTIEAARKEAERLARAYPEWEFLIFQAIEAAKVEIPPPPPVVFDRAISLK
jgi:hypothetical protein